MVQTGLLNAILTGIVTGSVIALGAIGLSLVYSIAEVPNFAHGELLMIGAYVAFLVNTPAEVPVLDLLATGPRALNAVGLAVLFAIGAGSTLGIVYLLGGRESLAGEWWPIDVPPAVAFAANAALAALVGALVVVGTPSVWGGMLLSMVVMAAFAPQLERFVFRTFREKGADLATMLIVTLGLAFVLRYTTQAYFGARNRVYVVPDRATVLDVTFPLSASQHFNLYLGGAGATLEWINTGSPGTPPRLVGVVGWSWPVVVGVLVAAGAAGGLAYRWRQRRMAAGGGATFRPGVVGAAVGAVALLAVGAVAAAPRAVPESAAYATQVRLSVMRAAVVGIALLMMTILHVLLTETKLGVAMRAASDNLDLAKVTGINTDRVMVATWVLAGAYAAVGGVMLGVLFSQIYPRMGFNLLLPMFAGVILGGVGSVYGAMLGSFLVGLSMDVGIALLNLDVSYRIPLAFVVLFVVLLVRPEGITGGG